VDQHFQEPLRDKEGEFMRVLRGLILFLPVFGLISVATAQVVQVEQPSCSISISTPESPIKAGLEVKLDITTKNVSDRTIYLVYSTVPGRNMRIDVRDSEGNPVSETPYGLKVHGTDPKRVPFSGTMFSTRVPVKPGETYEEKLVLSKEYDMSRPGRYSIRVQRSDVLNDTNTVTFVKSNTITVIVTP
jgi:hypothetical protein